MTCCTLSSLPWDFYPNTNQRHSSYPKLTNSTNEGNKPIRGGSWLHDILEKNMVLNTLEARNKLCSNIISLIFDQHCLMFDLSLVSSVCSDADFFLFCFGAFFTLSEWHVFVLVWRCWCSSAISSGSQCHTHLHNVYVTIILSVWMYYTVVLYQQLVVSIEKEESVVAESNHSDDSGENSGCM